MQRCTAPRWAGGFPPLGRLRATLVPQQAIASGSSNPLSTPRRFGTTSVPEPNLLHRRWPFWQKVKRWEGVSEDDFMSYEWQKKHTVEGKSKLQTFLDESVPPTIPASAPADAPIPKSQYLVDVEEGIGAASMAVRLTPYLLSLVDWADPANDPIIRQFVPLKSTMVEDHSLARLDSLGETNDSPVRNLVHRYPDKVLFLVTSVCPVYCRFCTRSYAIGANTDAVTKATIRSGRRRQEAMFEYIGNHPAIQDVVVSGGDTYTLRPDQLKDIGERLLSIPQIKRIRIASKGLAINPTRITDPNDTWADELIALSDRGRREGKQVALHTHFNHEREVTWITELGARRLFKAGVMVRNQSVLLRGVNDTVSAMSGLIRSIADLNIHPYYVYQHDMVPGLDDLRTPLSTAIFLDQHIRGTIGGFMTPTFVVDLPGGGGKRPVTSYESYEEENGVSKWSAPGVAGGKVFEYHDPRPI